MQAATAIAGLLRQAATRGGFQRRGAFLPHRDQRIAHSAPTPALRLLLARAALTNGDLPDAQRLTASARQAGASEAALAPLDAALAALAGVGGADADASAEAPDRCWRAGARDGARCVALAALGAQADEATQAFLAATPPSGGVAADAATMTALADAVQRQATGEVGLLAALALIAIAWTLECGIRLASDRRACAQPGLTPMRGAWRSRRSCKASRPRRRRPRRAARSPARAH